MQKPFRDDKQIETDLVQCSETLQHSFEKFYERDFTNEPSEIILEIKNVINLLNVTVEEISILKNHISILHDQVNTLQNKDSIQRIATLTSQSRKNAKELRNLIGLEEITLISPKTNISGLISEYAGDDEEVDSLEILRSIREDDDSD